LSAIAGRRTAKAGRKALSADEKKDNKDFKPRSGGMFVEKRRSNMFLAA